MKKDIRAVIFDSDGTLVDSEVPGMDMMHEMALAAGVDLDRDEAHARFRGERMADIARWIGERVVNKPEGFEEDFIRRYRAAMTCGCWSMASISARSCAPRRWVCWPRSSRPCRWCGRR